MPLPASRRFVKRVLRFVLTLAGVFLLGAILFAVRCASGGGPPKVISPAAVERQKITADIKDYARPEVGTYLSYPEWYIVWSYQERADFQETRLPTRFPFFGAIGQYWSGYCCTYGFTRGRYPFDIGDHVMLAVIGTSFSFEYVIRGVYESTVGRFTEWLSGHQPVEEDRYAYRVAREYADFVHIRPFYEFSFWKEFKGLWRQTSWWGPHPLRKFERKAFLAIDYSLQSFYCWLIEQMTHASYAYESADTYAWIENAPADLFTAIPRIRKVKEVASGTFIVIIPRYQEFTAIASQLAARDVHFVEIAGNDEVLLTVLAPRDYSDDGRDGQVLFSNGVLTRPDLRRIGVRTPVAALHSVLNSMTSHRLTIEHIYDY
jgi:hypothetical protein